jgi:hypothetical protein
MQRTQTRAPYNAVGRALAIAGRRANGGGIDTYAAPGAPTPQDTTPIAGPVIGSTGGREDALPVSVAAGSYVIPADVVAACGDGNTLAGMKLLEGHFGGTSTSGRSRTPAAAMMAAGGVSGAPGQAVPILISDGEYVVTPEQVAMIGGGDLDQGHRALDAFVRSKRAETVAKLKSLPGPAKG